MVIWGREKVGQGRMVEGYRVGWGFKEVGLGSMVACQVGWWVPSHCQPAPSKEPAQEGTPCCTQVLSILKNKNCCNFVYSERFLKRDGEGG